MRRPGDCLDGRLVVVEFSQRLRRTPGAPKKKFVIITAGGELLIVERPLEATYLLPMTH